MPGEFYRDGVGIQDEILGIHGAKKPATRRSSENRMAGLCLLAAV
jgi:hypothetical protein